MALARHINTREMEKFDVNGAGETVIRVEVDSMPSVAGTVTVSSVSTTVDVKGTVSVSNAYTDNLYNANVTIDAAHHKIHDGDSYLSGAWLDLTNGQVYKILIEAASTSLACHMVFKIASELETSFNFYAGTTTSNNGTPMSKFNRNRNSTKLGSLNIYHSPTVVSNGTLLGSGIMGSGKTYGGFMRDTQEIILKKGTKYMFEITNATVLANWLDYEFGWYEL